MFAPGTTRIAAALIAIGLVSVPLTRSSAADYEATEIDKLLASDGGGNDVFGWDVDVYDTYAIVGACGDDEGGGIDGGSAFIFHFDGSNWTQQIKIVAGDSHAGDLFGRSVAIWGQYAVIGACLGDGDITNCGSAYVYHRSDDTWSFQQELVAEGEDCEGGAYFGESVDIFSDWIIVGAYREDTDAGTDAGAAYIFHRSGSTWTQQDRLTADSGAHAEDFFGEAVAIRGDYAIVGARRYDSYGSDSGAAFIFHREDANWTRLLPRLAPNDLTVDDHFGCAVDIDGEVAIVGAEQHWPAGSNRTGAAYTYRRSGLSWPQDQKLWDADGAHWDRFGWAVSVAGNLIVIGAKGDDEGGSDYGSSYLFSDDGSQWVSECKMLASDGASFDDFGEAVALLDETALIGARYEDELGNDAGAAYLFDIEPIFCGGDLNGDDTVNVFDLLDLLDAWGDCPGCDADLNGDDVVNVFDLLELLGAWGPC